MKLIFASFTWFPHGGLTRDSISIARVCQQRGHTVRMYVQECRGTVDADLDVRVLAVKARTNHQKGMCFAKQLHNAVADFAPDLIVGFNRMPGLDAYYSADACFAEKASKRSWLYQHMPRARHFIELEKAVFEAKSHTQLLMIAKNQIPIYQHYYATPDARITLLPPGISRDRIAGADAQTQRSNFRKQWQLNENDKMLLAVGSGFRTKGADRIVKSFAALPESMRDKAHLFIVGIGKAKPYQKIAKQLGVDSRVRFLGGRDDVSAFLLSADLLIHPAREENTGTVLLEAMVAGLPVIATDVCGYAHYITDTKMGEVLTSPFNQDALNQSVQRIMKMKRDPWRLRAAQFSQTADIYDMPLRVCQRLEEISEQQTLF